MQVKMSTKLATAAVVATTVIITAMLSTAVGIGRPTGGSAYIVSGAHLKWTGPGDKARAVESGEYVARNVVPTRMAMRRDGTVFLAIPRLRNGVPFTLGVIEYDPCLSTIEPPVSPYPCAAAHRPRPRTNNRTLINVVDVHMDSDSGALLWALDVGKVNLLDNTAVVVRPPMLFAYDTDTDEIVRAIDLSRATTAAGSCLQSIVVDRNTAGHQLVYVMDAGLGNVIVYDVHCDRSFKVHVPVGQCGRQDVMYAVLVQVDVADAAAGGGVARQQRLYVTYLSSCEMMYVPVHAVDGNTASLPTVNIGRKPCKMIVLGTDHRSVIYFRTGGDTGTDDILSWDVNRPLCEENFRYVLKRDRKSRTPLMVTNGLRGHQWFMESNFIDLFTSDIGCLGVSTKIQPLRTTDGNEDDVCTSMTADKLLGVHNLM